MNKKELTEIKKFLYDVCNEAKKITLPGFKKNKNVKYKKDGSPVTKIDVDTEDIIRSLIFNKYPNHNILSEENPNLYNSSDYTWVIDPIDGTKSFIIGRPLWGTMISLIFKNKPIVGIVDFPCLNQTWLGGNNFCYLNQKLFKNTKNFNVDISDAIMASTGPDLFEKENIKKFKKISNLTKNNFWSGDCHNYILLINGGIDIVIEENLSCYDILPLIPILKSQKILITDWNGKEITFKFDKNLKYQVLACTNKEIQKKLLKYLN